MNLKTDNLVLTGLSEHHLQPFNDGHLLHHEVAAPFTALCEAAALDGIKITIVSSFRSFSRQAAIWQAKLDGKRPVYDRQQQPINILALPDIAKLDAILLYSALPGASRHHWGTEVDVYDAAAVEADYHPKLDTAEYDIGGPFYPMVKWLNKYAANYGFFMPYQQYRGGVAAEPWHLSYQPVADRFQHALTLELLQQCLQLHPIGCQETVLMQLPDIYLRFIQNTCPGPASESPIR